MTTKSKNGIFKPKLYHTNATTLSTNIPYYTKANLVNSYWKPAMETEYQGLINNYTWTLVPSQPTSNLLVTNGYLRLNNIQMVPFPGLKQDL